MPMTPEERRARIAQVQARAATSAASGERYSGFEELDRAAEKSWADVEGRGSIAPVRGALDYLTRGWAPKAAARVESWLPGGDDYETGKAKYLDAYEKTAAAAPAQYHGAGLVASVALDPVKTGGLGRLARFGVNTARAGVEGGSYAAGHSRADTTEGLFSDALEGAETGIKFGAPIAALAEAAPWLAKTARDYASEKWFKQSNAPPGQIGRAVPGGLEKSRAAGRYGRDHGLVGVLTSPKRFHENVVGREAALSSEYNSYLPQLDADLATAGRATDPAVNFDVFNVVDKAKDEIIDPNTGMWAKNQKVADSIDNDLAFPVAEASPAGTLPFTRAAERRTALGNNVDWRGDRNLASAERQLYGIWGKELLGKSETAAASLGRPDAGRFGELNREFDLLQTLEKATEKGAERQAGNSFGGVIPSMGAASAAASGDLSRAAKVFAALKLARVLGNGALAIGGDATATSAAALGNRAENMTHAPAFWEAILAEREAQRADPSRR